MQGTPAAMLVALLAAMLVVAAVGDLRSRIIPNWLNLAIALGALPFWWLSDLALWPDIAVRIGIAVLLLAIFAGLFAIGAMGGGDVKLIAALALWLPPPSIVELLLIMSIAGGALTLVMLIGHRLRKSATKLEVPYGVAIAFGGMWLIGQPILNQFG
jgi:prepilin peptidase CpaA